ncbi:ABC transporter permease subunit [Shewanella litorisediminis]|uniref:ABC transporter permease subunit n=1 Tax=Shewanella litorisediminis TaxID=1173586 RepID=A0ABX7FYZ2_9GAMM|nr:ABC transporter permease subunit [Shewanella litorisediminis]MCL2918775.1 ABC transporter permease subunit [Shewanella litorisediminis]QRH00256.1 ABC transporter permease subunit [Shewanella litorisediminis]
MSQPQLAHPGPLMHVWLIARQEVIKGFFNLRGLIALVAYCLVWGLILYYPIRSAAKYLADPHMRQMLTEMLGMVSPKHLLSWDVPELSLFWVISLYWFPLFAILSSADQFASDKSRKTFRFLVQRTGRDALFFGRVFGQLLLQSAYIITAGLATLILTLFREPELAATAISDGVLVLLNLLIVITPYIALMALLSLYANSARQATLFAVLVWCVLKILAALAAYYLPSLPSLDWLLPGSQIDLIVDNTPLGALLHAPLPLIQAAVLLALGLIYMKRSAL